MTDMLVKLYTLPPLKPILAQQQTNGVVIRRPLAAEKHIVVTWVQDNFYPHWASEVDVAFSREPISCFIAIEHEQTVGFACHDTTCRNFFGPTGVSESHRGRGIGKALLLACLHAMAAQGYAYAIVGDVGPTEFYAKLVGAIEIPDSTPGIYTGMLKHT
jgi:GNAT superfamily N-acetyltransferase